MSKNKFGTKNKYRWGTIYLSLYRCWNYRTFPRGGNSRREKSIGLCL